MANYPCCINSPSVRRSPATDITARTLGRDHAILGIAVITRNRELTIDIQDITLGTVDLAIVAAYFMVVFAIGFRMAQRTRSAEDLFLAGRRLGWLPIGLSLFASNISSTTMIGLTGAAYTWGIAVANYEWMAAPILVIFALFLVPLYLNVRIGTVPEFLEYRYNRHVRRYFSLLTIVANIVVDTAGTLFAGAIVLTLFIPGLDLFSAALLLAAIAVEIMANGLKELFPVLAGG